MKYFDIVWYSSKDGPGSRVVLFLQGCNLRCEWCHSPHSQMLSAPVLLFEEYCKRCMSCSKVCASCCHSFQDEKHTINRDLCMRCGKCILNCQSGALAYQYFEYPPDKLFDKIKAELRLLRGSGGLTVSGGEPLLQSGELKELLRLCKTEGVHTAVETSAGVDFTCFEETDRYVDCWLFGLKQTDAALCQEMTGSNIELVLKNFELLSRVSQKKIVVRTPLVAGFTDGLENISSISRLMKKNNVANIELLKYNPYTSHYYNATGLAFDETKYSETSRQHFDDIVKVFDDYGIKWRYLD